MPLPALETAAIAGDVAAALGRVPPRPGVGQVLGPDGRNLVLGIASNLRRWAAGHLGAGSPPAAGRRPKTNLAGIATGIAWVEADGPFRQRLLYERLMAPLVPLASRRDLEAPAFLHLDPAARFPRVSIRLKAEEDPGLFGPFRDRKAAERARDAVHRAFPLRPCDDAFEPHAELPLGLSCVFAQVRSCAAPCLCRTGEEEYRALAGRAASWLADRGGRDEAPPEVPPSVGRVAAARALVVDAGRRAVALFPVQAGRVGEATVANGANDGLAEALATIEWPVPQGPDDWPWLLAWLRSPRARASFLPVRQAEGVPELAARVVGVLPARFGGNVAAKRGKP